MSNCCCAPRWTPISGRQTPAAPHVGHGDPYRLSEDDVLLQTTTRLLLAPLARLVFRPVIEGRENVPRGGPVIVAANHLSFIDSLVIPLVAPRPVVFLAKAEYFRQPGLKGWLTRTCL